MFRNPNIKVWVTAEAKASRCCSTSTNGFSMVSSATFYHSSSLTMRHDAHSLLMCWYSSNPKYTIWGRLQTKINVANHSSVTGSGCLWKLFSKGKWIKDILLSHLAFLDQADWLMDEWWGDKKAEIDAVIVGSMADANVVSVAV